MGIAAGVIRPRGQATTGRANGDDIWCKPSDIQGFPAHRWAELPQRAPNYVRCGTPVPSSEQMALSRHTRVRNHQGPAHRWAELPPKGTELRPMWHARAKLRTNGTLQSAEGCRNQVTDYQRGNRQLLFWHEAVLDRPCTSRRYHGVPCRRVVSARRQGRRHRAGAISGVNPAADRG